MILESLGIAAPSLTSVICASESANMILESLGIAAIAGILIAWLIYNRPHKCRYCRQLVFRWHSFAKAIAPNKDKDGKTLYYHYDCWKEVEHGA